MKPVIRKTDRGYRLEAQVWLPRGIHEVFPFFANAANLDALTPPWLKFRVLTPMPVEMRQSLQLDYSLRVHGLPIRWKSEISAWDPPYRFVDEQRKGPYRRWYHEHLFEECNGGTTVIDRVDYAVPGGSLMHKMFVGPDLMKIFGYRMEALGRILGRAEFQESEPRANGPVPPGDSTLATESTAKL